MNRDPDIEFAIREEANDDGIFDENIIQQRINEYYNPERRLPRLIQFPVQFEGAHVFPPGPYNYEPPMFHPTILPINHPMQFNLMDLLQNLEQHINNLADIMEPLNLEHDDVALVATQKTLDEMENLDLQKLSQVLGKSEDDVKAMNCSVCLGDFDESEDTETYTVLPKCKHVYHTDCIKEYLRNYNYHCPVCRESCGDHEAKIENENEEDDP